MTSVSFYQKFTLRNLGTLMSLRDYNTVNNKWALIWFSVAWGPHVAIQSECGKFIWDLRQTSKTCVLLAASHERRSHGTLVMCFHIEVMHYVQWKHEEILVEKIKLYAARNGTFQWEAKYRVNNSDLLACIKECILIFKD